MAHLNPHRKDLKRRNKDIDLDNFRSEKRFISQQIANEILDLKLATGEDVENSLWVSSLERAKRRLTPQHGRFAPRSHSYSPGPPSQRRFELAAPSFTYRNPSRETTPLTAALTRSLGHARETTPSVALEATRRRGSTLLGALPSRLRRIAEDERPTRLA
ncbi:uncharacterized protein AMSG_05881 [Thecamonas trahens ATCC 50062]|uniref:Uncharacterized protein n=1 Tax=Thecamonas trahens ATCC 50062 TaxID=461836 RepID=A0A0L0DFM8_THETB|nr:hypothetical protein AMSG_05881 [Thecamonas trahens ATCC 50062]KNC50108.1 hypothetical protein AMSG_05881 [Thecamonas trahens ATCC 50062]|eukprot:XP_013757267.1 hypothetical protein AMSG_05881 [Thecamonas trahens ATCC 50062]